MNLRNLFRVECRHLCDITGLAFGYCAPGAMPLRSAVEIDPYGDYYLQQIGGFNISPSPYWLFLVSGMESSPARQAVVTAIIVQQLLSGIVNLLAVLGGVAYLALRGWFGVALNFVIRVGFWLLPLPTPRTEPDSGITNLKP